MREYNVILKRDIDYDEFWNDIESDTDGGKLYIPNRRVEFTNERPASLRQCWYLLTDEEAEQLKLDDRVFDVEIPPEHRDDIFIFRKEIQIGNFTKTTSDSGAFLNWGLVRSNDTTNVYGSGTTTTENYTYSLAGGGVDIVIQDSGIQVDHPEFQDKNGINRVQQLAWDLANGGGFVQSPNHYRDYDGHGTHVAGIAAGKTYGWAKDATIYSQKVSGLEGTGDSGTGISVTYAFDSIKNWHISKAGSRPTVVNMSWGYGQFYNTVTSVNYRGTSYTDGNTTGNATYRETNYGLINQSGAYAGYTYVCNARVSSVDTDVQELIDAGVIVCIAAGNRSFKVDITSGTDYDNYVVTNLGTYYYHRGSSPYDDEAIIVGSLDSTVYNVSNDQKATYSECGPGVTIYAPGTNIMSACSTTNAFSGENYYANPTYKQTNISGTSMASPQVAGIAALLLQAYPKLTPAQIRSNLLNNASTAVLRFNNTTTFAVTAPSSANYSINGSSNPTLTLIEGETYTFSLNASGHPFYIKTNQSTGTGNAYNTGVTNNGASTGTITFVVPIGAPTLYYNCQFHSGMRGTINIVSTINNDWTDNRTLKGGLAKVVYNRFNSIETSKVSGLTMTGLSFRII